MIIKGSHCPRCSEQIQYNGNYYCTYCTWALPDPIVKKEDKHAFNLAYTLLMHQRNEQPDVKNLCLDKDGRVL